MSNKFNKLFKQIISESFEPSVQDLQDVENLYEDDLTDGPTNDQIGEFILDDDYIITINKWSKGKNPYTYLVTMNDKVLFDGKEGFESLEYAIYEAVSELFGYSDYLADSYDFAETLDRVNETIIEK